MEKRILYIIDMEGFMVNKKFLCKELGYINVATGEVRSRFYKIGEFDKLSPQDKKTAAVCLHHVHGMLFRDKQNDEDPLNLDKFLLEIANEAAEEGMLVAFKGGNFEESRLKELKIKNYINLESIKCPKFEVIWRFIRQENVAAFNYVETLTCGRHRRLVGTGKVAHCPRKEVFCFKYFLENMKE